MIPMFKVFCHGDAAHDVADVLESGYIGQGKVVDAFEADLSKYMEGARPLTVNSCTSALDLALHLAGVRAGDEVITTAQTCTATNSVIVNRGAVPVFVDVDPCTGLIDPVDVARNITATTRAIMAVDWAGHPCDYAALCTHAIPVIEDAAHAVGTRYSGSHIGRSGGDYVCFSFQAIKHLTCGDGGAIVVPERMYERAKLLRWYGLDRTSNESFRCAQDIQESGYKYHMNDIAAAIGRANISHIDWLIDEHQKNAETLLSELTGVSGIQMPQLPELSSRSSWWLFNVLVADPAEFIRKMADRGVACSQVHARNDRHYAFRKVARLSDRLLGLDHFSAHQVSIPVGWWLKSQDIEKIVATVKECV